MGPLSDTGISQECLITPPPGLFRGINGSFWGVFGILDSNSGYVAVMVLCGIGYLSGSCLHRVALWHLQARGCSISC